MIVRIINVLGDCPDHCSENGSPRLHVSCTHVHLRDIYLDLATRFIHRLSARSGTTSVRCTCRCISFLFVRQLGSQLNWEFFLDPGTTCLCHLLLGSGTKWAHFTLRWMCLFFDPYASDVQGRYASRPLTFLFRNTSGHTWSGKKYFSFFFKSTMHSSDNRNLRL